MTDFDDIKRMLEVMEEHDLEEFELDQGGVRIRLRKRARGGAAVPAEPVAAPAEPVAAAPPAAEAPPASETPSVADGTIVVKSPIVGTFYRAPEPGSDPYVEVGSTVRKGQVLCIIEAMKLMNEIDAEHDGEVVQVLAENGQPVQYGEALFAIKPA